MHVFIEIPSGSKPISHLLLGKMSGNILPMLNFRKIYNPIVWQWVLLMDVECCSSCRLFAMHSVTLQVLLISYIC